MYFNEHPDGSITRKLVEDWTDEEKALDLRHKAFLKEAKALGYATRLNTDTLKWEARGTIPTTVIYSPGELAARGLTHEDVVKLIKENT